MAACSASREALLLIVSRSAVFEDDRTPNTPERSHSALLASLGVDLYRAGSGFTCICLLLVICGPLSWFLRTVIAVAADAAHLSRSLV